MDELRKDQMEERTGETGENIREMEFPVDQPEQIVKKAVGKYPAARKMDWCIVLAYYCGKYCKFIYQ